MVSGDRPGQQSTEQRLHPPLQPPGASPPVPQSAHRHRIVWLALIALLLSGLAVVFVLPYFVSNTQPTQRTVEVVEPGSSAGNKAEGTTARRQAEQTLQQFLHLQAELGRENAMVWAEAEWNAALQRARDGDRQFGERRFDQAARQYAEALAALQAVQASRAARLEQALAAGWQALDAGDAELAGEHFQLALAIEAEHAGAQQGLARARARPAVLEQLAVAETAEQTGNWMEARDAYQAVLELDKDYTPAANGLERVNQQIRVQAFNRAMDDALAALDDGRLTAAESALQQAATVDPDARSLQDARQRLVEARRRAALAGLRRAAADESRAENWRKAVKVYQQALEIDANAGFARRGLEKAEQRAALNQQFDRYLNEPARLYSPEPLANAERLLKQVKQVPADEPRLANKLKRLTALILEARQPVQVRMRSDGETEVVIYHVGRLGRFVDQQLELRPGTYTAVGSRPGYRDVRREFSVQPGHPDAIVDIRCEEPV